MKRVSVFIDGFNLYHALKGLNKPYLKWVDPVKLSTCFIAPPTETLERVLFFTAQPSHTPKDVQVRYRAYVSALRHFGVHVIEGKFKKKSIQCKCQGKPSIETTHEEKETDVNIALAIVEDAFERKSDKQIIITNDSDISPAIRMAKNKNPNLRINVITPPFDIKRANYDLIEAAGDINKNKKGQVFFQTRFIKKVHLERSLLPEKIDLQDGSQVLMPVAYKRISPL